MSKSRRKTNAVDNVKKLLGGLPEDHCVFCRRNVDNEECYGKKIQSGLTVHYFCMLFASGLSQRGQTDDQGIFGFLPEDIIKELRRGSRLRCSYCKEKGATVGCVVSRCRHVFHFGCGLQHNTMHQYFDTFSSFCGEHRLVQKVPKEEQLHGNEDINTECAICMTSVEMKPSIETLRSPCCRRRWFHRDCIKRYALAAGLYFFKCPLCNNKDKFQEEMLKHGIYIPDQDAAWELEPNAFNDLLERYLHCDAKVCRCEDGRDFNKDGGRWEILVCDWCGSKGSHVACHGLIRISKEDYVCQDCMEIHNKCINIPSAQKQKKLKSLKTLPSPRADKKVNKDKSKSQYSAEKSNRFRKSVDAAFPSHSSTPFMSPLNMKKVSPFNYSSIAKSPPSCTSTSPSSSVENQILPQQYSPTAKSRLDFKSPTSESDCAATSRQVRWKKRKRKETDKMRKSLNLEIDMAWSDPDSSVSDDENAPKRLRKRKSSCGPVYVKYSSNKNKDAKVESRIPVISPMNSTEMTRTFNSDEDPPILSPQYPCLVKPVCHTPNTEGPDEEERSKKSQESSFVEEITRTGDKNKKQENPTRFLTTHSKSKSTHKKQDKPVSYTVLKQKLDYNLAALSCPFAVSVSVERIPLNNKTNKRIQNPDSSDSDSDFTLAELGKKLSLGSAKNDSAITLAEVGKELSLPTTKNNGTISSHDESKERNISYEEFLKEVLKTQKDGAKRCGFKKRKYRKRFLPGQTSITKWFHTNTNKNSDSESHDSNEENKAPSGGESDISHHDNRLVNVNGQSEISNIEVPSVKEVKNNYESAAVSSPNLTLQASNAVSKSRVLRILRRGKSYTIRRTVLKGSSFRENVDRRVDACNHSDTTQVLELNTPQEKIDKQNGCMLSPSSEEKKNTGSYVSPSDNSEEGSQKTLLDFRHDQSDITESSPSLVLKHGIDRESFRDSLSTSMRSVDGNSSQSVIELSSEASLLSLENGKDNIHENSQMEASQSSTESLELGEDDVNDLFNTSFSSGPRDSRSVSQCITISTDTETDTDSIVDIDSDSGEGDGVPASQYIIRSFCEGEGFQELKIFVPNQDW